MLSAAWLVAGCGGAGTDAGQAPPAATPDTTAQAVLEALAFERTGRATADLGAADRDALAAELDTLRAVERVAAAEGLDREPRMAARAELARLRLLQEAMVGRKVDAIPVTDQDLREEFTRHYGREQSEYRLRHILVPDEQAARAALAKLGQGRAFEDVARSDSLDDSAARGGDLGWRRPEGLPAPIVALLADLAPGGHAAEPVKTQYGWHVVQLVDVRPLAGPDFDAVRPQLEVALRERREREYLASLPKR